MSVPSILVHPETEKLLDSVLKHEPHALLLAGPRGVGLSTLAKHYIQQNHAQVTTVLPEKDEKIDLEKGTITIQSIRRLYDATRTFEPNGRVIIIDYAERMAVPAQNAFLKLLEEPAQATRFVLLTHQPELLLPTITSRSQRVDVRPVTAEQSNELLDSLNVTNSTKRAQLLFIAQGLPAELTRLVNDTTLFEKRAEMMKDARTFITGNPYDRLVLAKKYKDSRPDALILLEDAMKLLRRTIAANGDTSALRAATRLESLHKRITEQGNVRLQLSAAVMV